MKKTILFVLCLVLICGVVLGGIQLGLNAAMPDYADNLGDDNYDEKLMGTDLVSASAQRPDNLILYGSSELRTTNISTHPANFFADKRAGFQVNLVGRGSCQSIIHALSIAGCGDALEGKRLVLITSPQSFVSGGIAPDLFLANFSKLHFYNIMLDPELDDSFRDTFSSRVEELLEEYYAKEGTYAGYEDVALYARLYNGGGMDHALLTLLSPYYRLCRTLEGLKDDWNSLSLLRSKGEANIQPENTSIDWEAELAAAAAEGAAASDNNHFGILNDYYNRYIGTKLEQQKDKDAGLSYADSEEYGDLTLLLELCRAKNIEVLFVHVPLHGQWSDYTGFDETARQTYYDKVSGILAGYDNVSVCDLTSDEYEPYFLCDVMHLGWKGWLKLDEALVDFYHRDR